MAGEQRKGKCFSTREVAHSDLPHVTCNPHATQTQSHLDSEPNRRSPGDLSSHSDIHQLLDLSHIIALLCQTGYQTVFIKPGPSLVDSQ